MKSLRISNIQFEFQNYKILYLYERFSPILAWFLVWFDIRGIGIRVQDVESISFWIDSIHNYTICNCFCSIFNSFYAFLFCTVNFAIWFQFYILGFGLLFTLTLRMFFHRLFGESIGILFANIDLDKIIPMPDYLLETQPLSKLIRFFRYSE